MGKLIILVSIALLSGCMKEDPKTPPHPYATNYTSITKLGIMMRNDGNSVPVSGTTADRIYNGVVSCMENYFGMSITAHPEDILLITTDVDVNPDNLYGIEGITYIMNSGDPRIVIAMNSPPGMTIYTWRLLSHEYVHALAPEFGITPAENRDHDNAVFDVCGYVVY